ncbi:MAG TPA: hypothetical protein VG106_04180 [Vicinamibacterales bacterium]|nr:hypothetical protein [Vicinamibacterales bacterium]
MPHARLAVFLLSIVAATTHAGDPAAERLHQQHLQDSLDLRLQQSLGRTQGLSQRDQLELHRLAVRQRMEQEALQQEHYVQSQRFAHEPHRRRMTDQLYQQEAANQRHRFHAEQQRLLGSLRAAPLQPLARPGELRLR